MQEVPRTILKKLNLRSAAEAEASHWRNLLPREPWGERLAQDPGKFARWVLTRLESGQRNSPGLVVDARKAHQAFRPVPVVGVAERIALRALTDLVLDGIELPERSRDDYEAFVRGPVRQAFEGKRFAQLSTASVEYVVEADIAAYYQYIDHGVLLRELETRTGRVQESRLLVELLGEIQGSTYGLPQLLAPSDKLSEIYIQILERDVTRRIGQVWRFNDDFRIAINGYGNAQQALEDLSAGARSLGLILNDRKSTILKFSTYWWRHFADEAGDSDVEIHPAEADVVDPDYPDLEGDDMVGAAEAILGRLDPDAEHPIVLKSASIDDVRALRRAFNALTRGASPLGLTHVTDVFSYIPQLVPRLCDYLVAVEPSDRDGVLEVWNAIADRARGYNVWQRAWLSFVARQCGFLEGRPLQWIREQSGGAPAGLLHAETSLALAVAGAGDFSALDAALRSQPEALSPWYALALNHLSISTEQRNAVRGSSKLFELLVDPPT